MKLNFREVNGPILGDAGQYVVYDVDANEAFLGKAKVLRHALVWELGVDSSGARLSVELDLDAKLSWIVRCDRVDFPPGGIAYRHTHPGGGIRCVIQGSLTVDTKGANKVYRPFDAWFENGSEPVYARASEIEATAFVRVMVLPAEWQGKRTIRYEDPADDDKPKLQTATIFFEHPLTN